MPGRIVTTIVSFTRVLCNVCLVFGLVVLSSSPPLRESATRLILKKTNRLMQAVIFSRRHFLCGAWLWNCSSAEESVEVHCIYTSTKGMFSRRTLQNPVSIRIFPTFPGSRLRLFIAMQFQSLSKTLYIISIRL